MKNKKISSIIIWILVLAVLGYGIYWVLGYERTPGELDAFARCLDDKGALFYGAFWCPHCQTQKQAFGKSENLLPYVECSTPDGRGQVQRCKNDGIDSYPTWIFADGEKRTGEMTLTFLSEKTGCQLP